MNSIAPLSARRVWFGWSLIWRIWDSSPWMDEDVSKFMGVVRAFSVGVVVMAFEDDDAGRLLLCDKYL